MYIRDFCSEFAYTRFERTQTGDWRRRISLSLIFFPPGNNDDDGDEREEEVGDERQKFIGMVRGSPRLGAVSDQIRREEGN